MVDFSREEIEGVYKAIYSRRDIRRFREDPISDDLLRELIDAAHHAPSVGFSQPWDFIVIRDEAIKEQIHNIASRAIDAAQVAYKEPQKSDFGQLKLEGIQKAPVNICVTCDPTRGEPHVLGRSSMRQMDLYSTCLAIQNLWLAARAEGIGVGWVSFLYPAEVREVLRMPPHIKPIAYLCIGHPEKFPDEPTLQKEGWRDRIGLDELVHYNGWESSQSSETKHR